MQKQFSYVFFCLLLQLLSGCAIVAKMPATRMDSPETSGKNHLKAHVAVAGTNDVVLTPDFMYTAPDTSNPTMDGGAQVYAGVGYGILEELDLGLRTDGTAQVKYQVSGSSRATAETGNSPLAFTLGLGYSKNKSTGSATLGGGIGTNGTNEKKEFIFDLAMIAGYRVSKGVLFYGGPFFTSKSVDGQVDYVGPASTVKYNGKATTVGGNLGVEFGSPVVQVKIEGGVAKASMGNLKETHARVGGELCFNFDLEPTPEPPPETAPKKN